MSIITFAFIVWALSNVGSFCIDLYIGFLKRRLIHNFSEDTPRSPRS